MKKPKVQRYSFMLVGNTIQCSELDMKEGEIVFGCPLGSCTTNKLGARNIQLFMQSVVEAMLDRQKETAE
jgi:hypothetical protein